MTTPNASEPTKVTLPPIVRRLGWVSFFTDAASEMLYPLIPIFLTVTLGAPVIALGLIEGLADGIATGLKAYAGNLADRVRRPKRLVAWGYSASALAKPLLALAPNWGVVGALRVSDRVGKAFRGAPRDMMIADAVSESHRGRAFGFHRMMDTSGAVLGPLVGLAVLLMVGTKDRTFNFGPFQGDIDPLRIVFLLALIPGIGALWMLRSLPDTVKKAPVNKWEPRPLPWRGKFGWFVAATILFSLGNSSDAFLLLRAKDLGLSTVQVILAYAFFNVIYAGISLPAGIKSDTMSRVKIIFAGWIAFAAVYLGFGLISDAWAVWPLLLVYGVYMGLTDGIARALVVDMVPENVRGKALGVTQAITGGCVLVAGLTAGLLWDQVSPSAPFILGACTSVLGAVFLLKAVATKPVEVAA